MKKVIAILLAVCLLLPLPPVPAAEHRSPLPPHLTKPKPPYPTPAQRRTNRARQS